MFSFASGVDQKIVHEYLRTFHVGQEILQTSLEDLQSRGYTEWHPEDLEPTHRRDERGQLGCRLHEGKPLLASSVQKTVVLASLARVSSTVGREKCSRFTLPFRFFRSTQIRTQPLDLCTGTSQRYSFPGR